jgi:DNA-binding response OmpR family regulator
LAGTHINTVLVVEDEEDMVALLGYNLSKAGFGLLIARPGLTGLELPERIAAMSSSSNSCFPIWLGTRLQALENSVEAASLLVVVLTARGEPGDGIKGLNSEPTIILTKPLHSRSGPQGE